VKGGREEGQVGELRGVLGGVGLAVRGEGCSLSVKQGFACPELKGGGVVSP
jgi:hypothetical protein